MNIPQTAGSTLASASAILRWSLATELALELAFEALEP